MFFEAVGIITCCILAIIAVAIAVAMIARFVSKLNDYQNAKWWEERYEAEERRRIGDAVHFEEKIAELQARIDVLEAERQGPYR